VIDLFFVWLTGDIISPDSDKQISQHKASIQVMRRFQFSSQLKRMSTISTVTFPPNNSRKTLIAVKGAPETLKSMYNSIPTGYEKSYKTFAQNGSRVLSLGFKWVENLQGKNQINSITREEVESGLNFGGFLVFNSPLKEDAVKSLKMLADSSHRVSLISNLWLISKGES
jgi:manganese-transporting P-type ATPase